IGRHVVAEAVRQGHTVRALVRSASKARDLDLAAQVMEGQLTDAATLTDAVDGIDGVVFTQGAYGNPEAVDYGAVKNVLTALEGRPVRMALMTAIGVTVRSEGHDWKRRGERLMRASGNHYTIVRPGWFDYNNADELQIVLLQGDKRRAGSPADGVIARHQIARVLVDSLTSAAATNLTFELVAERGPAQDSLEPVFSALQKDFSGGFDGVGDRDNMPSVSEPANVQDDLRSVAPSA
ncbi:MAG: hypothetical protein JWQ43_3621, partial [Glaciihabitans sp.]|nr:hypothetical protein [Glaciihabitans sp.]